jgi:tetratricopeptide (TPR) repeat protein
LIDERGIIRRVSPPLSEARSQLRQFLDEDLRGESHPAEIGRPTQNPGGQEVDFAHLRNLSAAGTADSLRDLADALVMWGDDADLDEAIGLYSRALALSPEDGRTYFRAGVAYQRRSESSGRQVGDFSAAVEHWQSALEIDPNNYIWRRRIQQYGPRLEKPYPFYDWVDLAREEISQRGEAPVPLRVEPRGAELAHPAEALDRTEAIESPDPGGRVTRDPGEMVQAEITVVPARVEPGRPARVHIVFRPRTETKAHWNNEVGDLAVWVGLPSGWESDSNYLTVPRPPEPVSGEERRVEIELLAGPSVAPGSHAVPAYALYYVCEDIYGACLYRRQDLEMELEVVAAKAAGR